MCPGTTVAKIRPAGIAEPSADSTRPISPSLILVAALFGDLEQIGVDTVVPRRDDLDLRPFLAAVLDERIAVLEGGVPLNRLGKDLPFRDSDTVHRLDDADLEILDLGDIPLGQLEQIRVDPVLARRAAPRSAALSGRRS